MFYGAALLLNAISLTVKVHYERLLIVLHLHLISMRWTVDSTVLSTTQSGYTGLLLFNTQAPWMQRAVQAKAHPATVICAAAIITPACQHSPNKHTAGL
jgi:hypothetical protein